MYFDLADPVRVVPIYIALVAVLHPRAHGLSPHHLRGLLPRSVSIETVQIAIFDLVLEIAIMS